MREIINRLEEQEVNPAINANEFELEIKPDPDNVGAQPLLTVNSLDFAYDEATKINDLIAKNGIYQGIKYSISRKEEGSELTILDGVLLPNGAETVYSKELIENMRVERRGKDDSLSRRAKTVIYSELLKEGFFTTADYIQVPYTLSSRPDYKAAAIISVTAFIVLDKLVVMAKEMAKVIADIGGVLSAMAGVLKIIVLVFWVIITLATLIIFMLSVLDQLIQPVKYHAGMLWKQLIEIGCAKLGYTFKSTIFDDEFIASAVIIPAKFETPESENNQVSARGFNFNLPSFGFTVPEETRANGYYTGSFFDLLQDTKDTFRAFITITSNNELVIERVGTPMSDPSFRMNPLIRMREHRTNGDEIIGFYGLRMLQDSADTNTYQNYNGTTTIVTTKRLVDGVENLIDGKQEVIIPFTKASTKKGFTPPEILADRLVKAYIEPINDVRILIIQANDLKNASIPKIRKVLKVLKALGVDIPFNPLPAPPIPPIEETIIEEREGMMTIENDFFTVTKVASFDIKSIPRLTNIRSDNDEKWHTEYIYRTYHAGQSHVPSDQFPFGNQRRIFEGLNTRVCKEDLVKVINNSIIFDPNGERSELISFKHNIHTSNSEIEWAVPYLNDPNLIETIETL